MNDSAENVARAFVKAINRQDMDGMAELMPPDHRFVDSLGTVDQGREKMLANWIAYFRMVPDYSIAVEEFFCVGPIVVILGWARGTYAPGGDLRPENHWETPLAIRALVENGLVAEWRAYADNEPIRQKMKRAS
ncbi:MAG: nuclear transport factor 2 family protein [Terracidiphilus sp.]|jgi:limonene-1,2-epoxide hydrolase